MAAECTKGMLWPYVRATGDCLTPDEIKAGQSGNYAGPLNTNPDVANMKVETPVEVNAPSSGGDGLLGNMFGFIPSTSGDDAVYDSLGPAGLIRRPEGVAQESCHKGALWPFVREAGDCLTDTERRDQGNTVYRADTLTATPASATGAAINAAAKPPAPPAETCHRSAFWPFVREVGDCRTEQEKKDAAANKQ
jgi:hypothetical protein